MKDDQEPSGPRPSGGILHAWLIAALAIAIVWLLSVVDSRTPNRLLLEFDEKVVAGQ